MTDSPKNGDDAVMFNKDFVAFLVSIALAFIVFTGFAYRSAFFKSLGIPLGEQDFDFAGLLLRGLFLMQSWDVFFGVGLAFGVLIFVYLRTNRSEPILHYGSMAVMFVGATWGAGVLGAWKGEEHARLMVSDNYGTPAICVLRPKAPKDGTDQDETMVREVFKKLGEGLQLKIVLETKDFMYFAVQLKPAPEILKGQSVAIPKKDIAYCRFIGR